jgi:hypothetical protein
MRRTLALVLSLFLVSGCSAALNNAALHTEYGLRAGSEAWSQYVEHVLDKCRETSTHTPEAWESCVGPTRDTNDKVGEAQTIAVYLLRAYWRAAAAGDRRGMHASLAKLRDHLESAGDLLPPEFRGLANALKNVR